MSFWLKMEDKKGCPRAVKPWTDVGNDALTPGDCHGSNNSILSKSGLMCFFLMTDSIKVCLNETNSKVHMSKYFSDAFLIQNGLKQLRTVLPLIFALESAIKKARVHIIGQ
jgi:hypothetical protein